MPGRAPGHVVPAQPLGEGGQEHRRDQHRLLDDRALAAPAECGERSPSRPVHRPDLPTDLCDDPQVALSTLFTDIVGSTEKAVALGDCAWADLLERHHAAVRAELARFGGDEMDTSGDGFFAVFPEPDAAVRAGLAIVGAVRGLGLVTRVGIHAGDCRLADGKCTGLAIHIGARIVALASPGEVLVSDPVRIGAGPDVGFADRGVHELRGVPGTWPLFAASTAT